MSLKMAALCPDANLETLRPLCCHRTHRLQADLCRCFHEGSLQAVQGGEVWTPRGPILGVDKGRNISPQPLLSRLGLVGRKGENCIRYVFHGLKHPKCQSRVVTRFGGPRFYAFLWVCKLTVHKPVPQIFETELLAHNLVKPLQLPFTMLCGNQLPNQNYVLLRICISSDGVGIDQHGRQPKC